MRICPQCKTETTERTCPHDGFNTVLASRYKKDATDPLIGQTFVGRYKIEAVLGRGGMGAVYRANQLAVNRSVAIKILKTDLADDLKEVARFQQEARAIAALGHPNTIRLIDFGATDDGALFLVMEYLQGRGLSDLIKKEAPIPAERVIHISAQVLEALSEAHAQGIIHRDLKPENIFVTEVYGKTDYVKLLDFGIAKLAEDAGEAAHLTQTGMFVGSPRYMAPEQVRSQWVSDRTDVYSLGAVAYELLCGQPVFKADTPTGYLIAHVQEPPQPPSIDGFMMRGPLVDWVMHCLEKKPDHRPQGALAALKMLHACAKSDKPAWVDYDSPIGEPADGDGGAEPAPQPDQNTAVHPGPIDTDVRKVAQVAAQQADTGKNGGKKLDVESIDPVATGMQPAPIGVPAPDAQPSEGRPPWMWAAAAGIVVAAGLGIFLAVGGGDEPTQPRSGGVVAERSPAASAGASVPEDQPPADGDEDRATEAPAGGSEAKAADEKAEAKTDGDEKAEAKTDGDEKTDAKTDGDEKAEAKTDGDEKAEAKEKADAEKEEPAEPAIVAQDATIVTDPAGAEVWQGEIKLGETPVIVSWLSSEPPPKVVVKRRGYKDKDVQLSLQDKGQTVTVELDKKPRKRPIRKKKKKKRKYELL